MNYYVSNLLDLFQKDESLLTETQNRWSAAIQKEDTVFLLGDCLSASEQRSAGFLSSLPGHKVMIRGDRDMVPGDSSFPDDILDYTEIRDHDYPVVLCHYPILFYKGRSKGSVMLFGHAGEGIESILLKRIRNSILETGACYNLIPVGSDEDPVSYVPKTIEDILREESYRGADTVHTDPGRFSEEDMLGPDHNAGLMLVYAVRYALHREKNEAFCVTDYIMHHIKAMDNQSVACMEKDISAFPFDGKPDASYWQTALQLLQEEIVQRKIPSWK